VGRPLWRVVGSVVFSFCRTSPAQPFSDLSPTGLMSKFYCLYFWDSPNLEGQVPIFISRRNRLAQLHPRALGFESQLKFHSSFSYDMDLTENVSSITACLLFAGETTCLQSCSIATDVILSSICTAANWQWLYMSQYVFQIRYCNYLNCYLD
jgi:hypothetical protein